MKSFLFFIHSFLFISSAFTQTNKAKELVSKMTLDEKVNLVVGMGMNMPGMNTGGPVVGQTMDKVPGAAGTIKQMSVFSLAKDIVVEKVNKVLTPQVTISELKK